MYESDSPNQFYLLSDEQQKILCSWIKENFIPTKNINTQDDSFYLHGIFERTPNGFFINNGMFKQAMKLCGFNIADESKQNWLFNVSKRSPAYAIRHTY